MTTWEETRAAWEHLERVARDAAEAASRLTHAAHAMEIRLYELEGRGHLAHCEWLREWLTPFAGRCNEILASEAYQREARAHEDRHEAPPQRSQLPVLATVQCQCCGRPAQVCVCEEAPPDPAAETEAQAARGN